MTTRRLAEAAAGTAAGRPAAAAGNSGDLYFATDTGTTWRSNGTAWVKVSSDPSALSNGSVNYRETVPRWAAGTNHAALGVGAMTLTGIALYAGDVVTSLSAMSATTALTQGSNNDGHWWFALYDTTLTLMAQTADQTTAAWASNAVKTLNLSSAQTITTTGWYWVAVMVAPGTGGSPAAPTLRGAPAGHANLYTGSGWPTGAKILSGSNGSGLTTTAPAGPIVLTASSICFYVMTS